MKRSVADEFLYVISRSLKNYNNCFYLNVAGFLKYKFISKLFSKQESNTKKEGGGYAYAYKLLVHFEGNTHILKKFICKLIKPTCIRPCLLRAILTFRNRASYI